MIHPLSYHSKYDELTASEIQLLQRALMVIEKFVSKSSQISDVKYATRDAHAKTYAFVKATFEPEKEGLLSDLLPENEYQGMVRFSHANLKIIKTDQQLHLYGLSIKISLNDTQEINFPLVNFPLFVTNSVTRFLRLFIQVNQLMIANSFKKIDHFTELITEFFPMSTEIMDRDFLRSLNHFRKTFSYFILAHNYHSIGVYRLGDKMMKLKAVPTLFYPEFGEGITIANQIENYIQNHLFGFKIFAQLAYDEKNQPINTLTKNWRNTPDIYMGELKLKNLLPHNLLTENMSFNPFDNPDTFLPVGKIQQLRKEAYKVSIMTRRNLNENNEV